MTKNSANRKNKNIQYDNKYYIEDSCNYFELEVEKEEYDKSQLIEELESI